MSLNLSADHTSPNSDQEPTIFFSKGTITKNKHIRKVIEIEKGLLILVGNYYLGIIRVLT